MDMRLHMPGSLPRGAAYFRKENLKIFPGFRESFCKKGLYQGNRRRGSWASVSNWQLDLEFSRRQDAEA
jgi:hypothetical protein